MEDPEVQFHLVFQSPFSVFIDSGADTGFIDSGLAKCLGPEPCLFLNHCRFEHLMIIYYIKSHSRPSQYA